MHLLPIGISPSLTQSFPKTLSILIVLENGATPITAIHHEINCSGIFNSESSLLGENKSACEELLVRSSYSLLEFDVDTLAILDFLDPQLLPEIQLG